MGQQQLLLIVLGIIVVSIAIFVGVTLFRSNAIESKRNNVINESINLAGMAQQYYVKPTEYGGGNKKFTGWRIPASLQLTANGRFEAVVHEEYVEIKGIGNEVVTGSDSVEILTTVYINSITTEIIR